MRIPTTILCATLLFLAACSRPSLQPVDLFPEDMCAWCKMAISEKQYAAEFITRDGDAFKFDDLGCLANYISSRQNGAEIAACYVMDVDEKRWMRAETAFFVTSEKRHTPMGGGIVAFREKAKAEAAAAAGQGRLLSWDAVLRARQ